MSHAAEEGRSVHVSEKVTLPLCVIIFFSVLNGMMFNVALPDIAAEFHLLPSQVSLIITAYVLLFGLGSLVYGRLAGFYSIRMLITVGLLLLNVGSVVGYLSPWYPMVIAGRLIQAAGGAAIPALAMLVATSYLPSNIRGKVLGLIASTVALAAGFGPILGGFVAGTLGWRSLFLVTLITVTTIPSLRRLLPDDSGSQPPFTFRGVIYLGALLGLLLFSLTRGDWRFLPAAAAAAFILVRHLMRSSAPLLPPALFLNRPFRTTAIVTVMAMGTVFGMMFATPLMLSHTIGLDVTDIGLTLFPGAMSAAILGMYGGRLIDRRGSAFVASAGMALIIAGFLLLSTFSGFSAVTIALVLPVTYAGFSFLQSSLPHAASTALSREFTGVGMGFYNLTFFVSGAFSSAVIGRILDIRPGWFCLNPAATCVEGWPYSNVYMLLAVIAGAALLLQRTASRGPTAKAASGERVRAGTFSERHRGSR